MRTPLKLLAIVLLGLAFLLGSYAAIKFVRTREANAELQEVNAAAMKASAMTAGACLAGAVLCLALRGRYRKS